MKSCAKAVAFWRNEQSAMRREVRETFAAKRDRLDIWLYIANDSIRAADTLIADILQTSRRLSDFPESAQPRPDLGNGIRSIPIANYIIFYRFDPEAIHVLRILHAARDITPDLLAE